MNQEDLLARRGLVAIVVAAAVLRFWGIGFGLPHAYARPDEVEAVTTAISVASGDLNPHFFHWPSLQFYLLAGLFRADAWLRGEAPQAFGKLPFGHYALIARHWSAALGVVTVPVCYFLARISAGPTVALLAALFLAVAPLHVRDSHFAMTDVTMTLLVTMSIWMLVAGAVRLESTLGNPERRREAGGLRRVALAGFVGGLATGTKYTAAGLLGPAILLHLWLLAHAPRKSRRWWFVPGPLFAGSLGLGFLLSTPYAALDFAKFTSDLALVASHHAGGHGPQLGIGFVRHLTFSLPYGLGWFAFGAACVGILVAIRRGGLVNWLLLSLIGTVFVGTGRGYTVFARYVLPIVPLLCVMAAFAVEAFWRQRLWSRWSFAGLLAVAIAPSALNSVWMDMLLSRTDTRVLASQWLTSRLLPEATVFQSGSEYVGVDIHSTNPHRWYYDTQTRHFQNATPDMMPHWLIVSRSPVSAYTDVPPAIAALAQKRYVPVKVFAATVGDGNPRDYDLQDAFFLPLAGYWNVRRPGPTITVYLRRDLLRAGMANDAPGRSSTRPRASP